MPPITRENEGQAEAAESQVRSGTVAGNGDTKQQPVALEVAVTVNGARTIEGDKREPFSETTKTVLIFGNGAVIRLTSSVAPGQLLFLTNERTKKEVVCQVVKSKNYKNVSGYVELEFTEPVVGFWGMRFPADRIGPGGSAEEIPPTAVSSPTPVPTAPAAVNTTRPVVPSTSTPTRPALHASPSPEAGPTRGSAIAPPMDSASPLGASKPRLEEFPFPVAQEFEPSTPLRPKPDAAAPVAASQPPAAKTPLPTSPNFNMRRASDQPASILAPKSSGTVDLSNVAPFYEVRPSSPAETAPPAPQRPPANNSQTEELRQQTARLQEQLSHMEFTEADRRAQTAKRAPETAATPARKDKELQDSIAHVLEVAKTSAPKAEEHAVAPREAVKTASESRETSQKEEELKIPAWLEPLARNAAAPTSTQELVQREKARRLAEQIYSEEPQLTEPVDEELPTGALQPSTAAPEEEPIAEPLTEEFGTEAAGEPEASSEFEEETESTGSKKTLLLGTIAAVVVLFAAGGWWFFRHTKAQPGIAATVKTPSSPAATIPAPNISSGEAAVPNAGGAQPEIPAPRPSPARSGAQGNVNPGGAGRASLSPAAARNAQAPPVRGGAAETADASPSAPEEKKVGLGEVRLATPKVSQTRTAQSGAQADAGVSLEQVQTENAGAALGASLPVGNSQPAAPTAPSALPVGGDVKQAKLISQVSPVYPALAKNQHISGNVVIDALIDVNGRVTTMKVMSGPTLLHQAAMDALKQWKYQPATLDGRPVPMHLTVTLQFRLQ